MKDRYSQENNKDAWTNPNKYHSVPREFSQEERVVHEVVSRMVAGGVRPSYRNILQELHSVQDWRQILTSQ